MTEPKRVLVVLGTRPEVIKLRPVIMGLKERRDDLATFVHFTGQHGGAWRLVKELGLLDKTFYAHQCGSGRRRDLPGEMTFTLTDALRDLAPVVPGVDLIVVQGDTLSAFAGALAGFLADKPVAHVEAGLRTYDLAAPFPEEGLRQMISRIATLHFAPSHLADANLTDELLYARPHANASGRASRVVGNTIVDALRLIHPEVPDRAADVLVTFHRRESWDRVVDVADAVRAIGLAGLRVRWVLHPNPDLARRVRALTQGPGDENLELVDPLPYREFIGQLTEAGCVVTDSGGVLEEATTLGAHSVVLRGTTERREAIAAGYAELLPLDRLEHLPAAVHRALLKERRPSSVFGDGRASERIVQAISEYLGERTTDRTTPSS